MLESGEGYEIAVPVLAHQAEPQRRGRPGCPAWCAPVVWPGLGAVVEDDSVLGLETGCWSTSGVPRAGQWPVPGLSAGGEEKGFERLALVTRSVQAEMNLENSGPQDGQEGGFLVLGVLEQVF